MKLTGFASIVLATGAMSMLGMTRIAAADDAPAVRAPGSAMMIGATATATVKAIDADKRIITLQKEDGDTVDVKCGEEVRNFDQIKVGDQVKAAAMARLVVAVGDSASQSDQGGVFIARTPKGDRPGAIIARTEQVTAKVDAVDPAKKTVTLSGIGDKPQTIDVASDVDLSSVKPGDSVNLRLTKGIALWVSNPQDAQPAAGTVKPEGLPGDFAAMSGESAAATVDAIDPATRTVTLKGADGTTRSIQLGKACVNFDQIKVGDQVRATVADEVAISVQKGGGPPSADNDAMVALAPKGAKPGMIIADTDDITGKISAIDAAKGTITLSLPDGSSRTIKAGPDVKVSELNQGDDVTARITQAMAIVVSKPG